MSPYIETINLLDGVLRNLQYHQERFERTRSEDLRLKSHPELGKIIQIPDGLDLGNYKCRVVYGKEIERIEFEPHVDKTIKSLKLVSSDTIFYGYKFADRSALDLLFRLRGSCDDIVIVKNGCITDSYYANVIFWNGVGWYTPDTPLLPGTMRASLLADGSIAEQRIRPDDLSKFQKLRLINAMNDLNGGQELPIEAVKY
jgi:4-amino-4-deoxychorismate lyase